MEKEKVILVTGFDPFGGAVINPAWEAVKRLPDAIGKAKIVKQMVPTVYGKGAETVLKTAEQCQPAAIILVGQAGGRNAVTPERVAVNISECTIPDNEGILHSNEPVLPMDLPPILIPSAHTTWSDK